MINPNIQSTTQHTTQSSSQPMPPCAPPYAQTNALAVVSLVTSVIIAPAGLVTGLIALNQIRRTQERGQSLAIAGISIAGAILFIEFSALSALSALVLLGR